MPEAVALLLGPNLTYAGSRATLLWRRVVRIGADEIELWEFTRLAALTVPPALVAATVAVWLSVRVV